MWWLYVKVKETEELIIYHYSTETKELDGEIVYKKGPKEWEVTRPCAKDKDSRWCIDKSEEKFWHVIEEGFPDRRMVAIG